MCLALGLGLLCSTSILAEVAAQQKLGVNELKALGNSAAPEATATVYYNLSGSVLAFELQVGGLAAGKAYQLRYQDSVLGELQADEAGIAQVAGQVEDAAVLQAVSGDEQCRLDLWQQSHRLARSAEYLRFQYEQ
jgi:hypothetical protein